MSEIPFVNQLGDAIESAIAAPRRRPWLGRRRYLTVAVAALAVAGGGAAVAGMLTDPVQLAAGSVSCFHNADLTGDVTMDRDVNRSPTELCAERLYGNVGAAGDLIACSWNGSSVAVVPRGRGRTCAGLGLAALPRDYTASRVRVAKLERDVIALERSADCIPPRTFVLRLRALLARYGWRGWRPWLRLDISDGPCARVSALTGAGTREISGSLDVQGRRIMVRGGAPRSLEAQLYGGSEPLGTRLMDSSGERCFTTVGLEEHARTMLAPTKRPIQFRFGSKPKASGVMPPRGDRYAEGCAIIVETGPVYPAPGEVAVEVEIWRP